MKVEGIAEGGRMHKRNVSLSVSAGILLALLLAAAIHRSALAKTCYDAQNQVIPCPNYQNPTQSVPPTATVQSPQANPVALPPNEAPPAQTLAINSPNLLGVYVPWLTGFGGIFLGFVLGSFFTLRSLKIREAALNVREAALKVREAARGPGIADPIHYHDET